MADKKKKTKAPATPPAPDAPEETTIAAQLQNAVALISSLGKRYSVKHDVIMNVFSILLNYDVTIKQMEMGGYRPEGARVIPPEELKARMEAASAEITPDEPKE